MSGERITVSGARGYSFATQARQQGAASVIDAAPDDTDAEVLDKLVAAASTGVTGEVTAAKDAALLELDTATELHLTEVDDATTEAVADIEAAAADADDAYNAAVDLIGTPAAITAANSEGIREGNTRLVGIDRTTAGIDQWDSLKTSETTSVFAQDGSNSRWHISWMATQKGFAEDGVIVMDEIRTGLLPERNNGTLSTTTGAKVQSILVRPNATPSDVNGAAITFTKVADIGEEPLLDNQTNYRDNVAIVPPVPIPHLAGDMVARRVIGAGIRYGANSGGTHEYDDTRSAIVSIADQTLAGSFATPQATTLTTGANGGRRFFGRTTSIKAGTLSGERGPRSLLRLDADGRIPVQVSRLADNPWHGKKVAFFGSSISTYTGGGSGAIKGHLRTIAEALQCNVYDYAVGGSYGLWPPTSVTPGGGVSAYHGMTAAEELARYGTAIYSYENRWINDGPFDAVVFPDLINDTNSAVFSIGTQGSTDRATLWGNFSRRIEYVLTQNPRCLIFLQTPAHEWAAYGGSGAPTVSTVGGSTRRQWVAALEAIRSAYGLPPLINFIEYGGISSYRVQSGTGLIDSIHPAEVNGPKPQMAQHGYDIMRSAGILL